MGIPAQGVQLRMNDACAIAAEHFAWARRDGQSLVQILASIGLTPKPGDGEDDVRVALERAWLMICEPVITDLHAIHRTNGGRRAA